MAWRFSYEFYELHEKRFGDKIVEILCKALSYAVIGAAIEMHHILRPGLPEAVYQAALAHKLRWRGIPFKEQVRLLVIRRASW